MSELICNRSSAALGWNWHAVHASIQEPSGHILQPRLSTPQDQAQQLHDARAIVMGSGSLPYFQQGRMAMHSCSLACKCSHTRMAAPSLPQARRGLQIASAYRRMVATYVEGNDQSQGSGGPAQTRDLLRFLYSIDVALSRTDNLAKRHPSVQDITTIESEKAHPRKPGGCCSSWRHQERLWLHASSTKQMCSSHDAVSLLQLCWS